MNTQAPTKERHTYGTSMSKRQRNIQNKNNLEPYTQKLNAKKKNKNKNKHINKQKESWLNNKKQHTFTRKKKTIKTTYIKSIRRARKNINKPDFFFKVLLYFQAICGN